MTARGAAGTTHCGRWVPVDPAEFDGRARLVCVREPHTKGEHRTVDGWRWRTGTTVWQRPTAARPAGVR